MNAGQKSIAHFLRMEIARKKEHLRCDTMEIGEAIKRIPISRQRLIDLQQQIGDLQIELDRLELIP